MEAEKPKLLIVDDEPDMLDFLERVLRRKYRVTRARSANEALTCLAQCAYDVLITDQKMPHTTGVELLEQIRDRYPGLVKVLISGFTDVPDIQRAVERCGIHNYILKPIDSQKLLEAIERAFRIRDGDPFPHPES